METSIPDLLTVSQMARLLGVESAWLRAEAEAGKIPHVVAGRTLLFSPHAVRTILGQRAMVEGLRFGFPEVLA